MLGERLYHADDHAVGQLYSALHFQQSVPFATALGPTQTSFDAILAAPASDVTLDFSVEGMRAHMYVCLSGSGCGVCIKNSFSLTQSCHSSVLMLEHVSSRVSASRQAIRGPSQQILPGTSVSQVYMHESKFWAATRWLLLQLHFTIVLSCVMRAAARIACQTLFRSHWCDMCTHACRN